MQLANECLEKVFNSLQDCDFAMIVLSLLLVLTRVSCSIKWRAVDMNCMQEELISEY